MYDAWNRLVKVTGANGTVLAEYSYDALGRRITETQGVYSNPTTTDLYYSNQDQVVQENVGSLVTAEHVWSPFYVDAMIETDTDPQVTTSQSNGSVDSGFGTNTSNGTTTTTLSSAVTAARAAVDPVDGNDIVVATMVGSTPELLFYTPSGALDTTYGSGTGIVSLSYSLTGINGLVVQENGLIDLAVTTSSGGMSVVELNANGTADTSFGSSGIKTLSGLPLALGIAIAGNGDVLVMGTSVNAFVVAELNPTTGALDTSYSTSGSASLTVAPSGSTIAFIGRAIAPDGDLILVAEYNAGSPAVPYLVIAAVDPSGQFDASFGTSGMFTQTTGSSASSKGISPVAVNAAGDIFVGRATNSGSNVTLNVSEYTPNGSVDTSFGTSGTASINISGTNTGVILEIQLNGQIVIGAAGSGTSFELARFNPDGSRDMSFGSSGIETGASESAGFAMITAANGESIIIGKPSSGNGIILQEFHTLAKTFTYYVEYDADYNVTSLTDSSGNVLERYEYDPYGNVTVLNVDGTTRGDGTAASSFFGWVYLHQGLRLSLATGLYDDRARIYDPSLGRFLQEDPAGDVNGPNTYQDQVSSPAGGLDPSGTQDAPSTQPADSANYDPLAAYPHPPGPPKPYVPEPLGNPDWAVQAANRRAEQNLEDAPVCLTKGDPKSGGSHVQNTGTAVKLTWYSICHPTQVTKAIEGGMSGYFAARYYAYEFRDEMVAYYKLHDVPGSGVDSANSNAFRHLYWQAYLAFNYGSEIAKLIGDGHELGEPGSADSQRDIANNQVGREIGCRAKSENDLKALVEQAIRNGQAFDENTIDPDSPTPYKMPGTLPPSKYSNN